MKAASFYEQILGLEKPWRVGRVNLDVGAQQVDLWLSPGSGIRWACPECGAACAVYDHAEERSWRHLDTCQFKTLIHARIPRVNCEKCGVRQVKTSWAEARSRFTLMMEKLVIEGLEHTRSVKTTCELTGIHWESCMPVMRRAVVRGQPSPGFDRGACLCYSFAPHAKSRVNCSRIEPTARRFTL